MIARNIWDKMSKEDQARYECEQALYAATTEKIVRGQERMLRKELVQWLGLRELDYITARTDKKSTIKLGASDFFIWRGNRFCLIELKGEHGKLSPEQLSFTERQRERGTPILVTSSYLEATDFVIQQLGLEPRGRPLVEILDNAV